MLNMYSPSSSSQFRTSIAKGIPLCKQGVHIILQVVKKGTRIVLRFEYKAVAGAVLFALMHD